MNSLNLYGLIMPIRNGVFVKLILQNLRNRKKQHNIYLFCLHLKYLKIQLMAYVLPVQKAIIDFLTRPASIAKISSDIIKKTNFLVHTFILPSKIQRVL